MNLKRVIKRINKAFVERLFKEYSCGHKDEFYCYVDKVEKMMFDTNDENTKTFDFVIKYGRYKEGMDTNFEHTVTLPDIGDYSYEFFKGMAYAVILAKDDYFR